MEIAGPLAALYIFRKSPSYRSHDFQSLQLDSIIKWVLSSEDFNSESNEEQTVDLIKAFSFSKNKVKVCSGSSSENDSGDSDSDNDIIGNSSLDAFLDKSQTRKDIYRPVRPVDDYIYRPVKFSNLTLYEFTSKVYRGKRKDGEKITDQGFQERHPLRDTHVLRIRKHEVIPILNGKRIKSISDESSALEKETNSVIALILHKPFRNALIDLKGLNSTWYDAFKNWEQSAEIRQLIMNAYDCDIARRRAGEISRQEKHETPSGCSDSGSDDESDNVV